MFVPLSKMVIGSFVDRMIKIERAGINRQFLESIEREVSLAKNYRIRIAQRFDRKLDAHTGDIATSINIAPHAKERTKYRLTLEVQVKPTAQKEKEFFPYFVAVKGRAFFTFNDPCSPEEADISP